MLQSIHAQTEHSSQTYGKPRAEELVGYETVHLLKYSLATGKTMTCMVKSPFDCMAWRTVGETTAWSGELQVR